MHTLERIRGTVPVGRVAHRGAPPVGLRAGGDALSDPGAGV